MSLEVIGGDAAVRQLRLKALLPEGKLVFGSKALDLGGIPVGVPQTSVVILKNIGLHDAMFQVRFPFVASYACYDRLDFALHQPTATLPLLQCWQIVTNALQCALQCTSIQFSDPTLTAQQPRPSAQTQQTLFNPTASVSKQQR